MEIIKITKNMKFLLEIEKGLPVREADEVIEKWNAAFPDNKLIIVVKNTVKILDIET